jgi:hypothetical protein
MLDLDPNLQPKRLQQMLPRFEYVFQTRVVTGEVLRMPYGAGERLMVQISGGDIDGPRLRGTILPGGIEWPTYRPDGVGMVDACYTFRSHDGVHINIRNRGYRRAAPEVMRRLNALDEFVDPAEYYIRTTPLFEAPPGPYGWLADHCFVGIGERQKECLFMRYYMVL